MTPGLVPAGVTLLAVALVRQRRGHPALLGRPDPNKARFYFFGVFTEVGHHWFPADRYAQDKTPYGPTGCPWGDRHVDAFLCPDSTSRENRETPREAQVEGLARLHHKDGWTALAYWDRSGPDKRYGCNSNFVAEGVLSFEQMLALARRHFPHVIDRTKGKFDIRLE